VNENHDGGGRRVRGRGAEREGETADGGRESRSSVGCGAG